MTDHANMTLPGSTGSVMSIKLESNTQRTDVFPDKATKKKSSPQQLVKSLTTLTKKSEHAYTKASRTEQAPNKNAQKKPLNTTTRSSVSSQSRAHVISIVYEQLSNNFNYPRIAQLHNWQGKVVLTFHITTKGDIANIQLNQSSGYAILDDAAISALSKIGKLPLLANSIKTDMEIQLPVLYQLTQG